MENKTTLMQHQHSDFVFFWKPEGPNGYLGNWFSSPFQDDVGHLFPTSEHYLMWRKALLMRDTDIAAKVLATNNPKTVKSLGRKVKTPDGKWDEELWLAHRRQIMIDALMLKFQQHADLRAQLLSTGDRTLVEASPLDRIWGIGVGSSNPIATQPEKWKGLNLLGECLMEVREKLRG